MKYLGQFFRFFELCRNVLRNGFPNIFCQTADGAGVALACLDSWVVGSLSAHTLASLLPGPPVFREALTLLSAPQSSGTVVLRTRASLPCPWGGKVLSSMAGTGILVTSGSCNVLRWHRWVSR